MLGARNVKPAGRQGKTRLIDLPVSSIAETARVALESSSGIQMKRKVSESTGGLIESLYASYAR
jgi:hypothetical protein